ncbi:MAG: hypothetical protein AAGJ35_13480, partial [Myxococcota bacterium]
HRFVDVIHRLEDGRTRLDLRHFHETEEMTPQTCFDFVQEEQSKKVLHQGDTSELETVCVSLSERQKQDNA